MKKMRIDPKSAAIGFAAGLVALYVYNNYIKPAVVANLSLAYPGFPALPAGITLPPGISYPPAYPTAPTYPTLLRSVPRPTLPAGFTYPSIGFTPGQSIIPQLPAGTVPTGFPSFKNIRTAADCNAAVDSSIGFLAGMLGTSASILTSNIGPQIATLRTNCDSISSLQPAHPGRIPR
jgi:hypothetical protein